jgi:heat shock protein HslJ
MKKTIFTLAIVLLAFTGCKNKDTDESTNEAFDSTSVQQDTVQVENDTLTYDSTGVSGTDSTDVKSDVKLPNKISATSKVIPGEKGKFSLAETKWGLTELNGKAVESAGRDYFINFDSSSGKFRAFVGCNRITGTYFMKSEGKLGFSNIISTRKACDDMDVERNFFNNLQKVDSYMIEDDGKVMHLHIGKKTAAKFKAIR